MVNVTTAENQDIYPEIVIREEKEKGMTGMTEGTEGTGMKENAISAKSLDILLKNALMISN